MQSYAHLPKKWRLARVSILLGTVALLGVSMLLAACGPTPPGTSSIKKGGTITEVISQEPDSLLPFAAGLTFSVLVDNSIWAPLWYSDNQIPATLHPGLAKVVPSLSNGGISADAKTYTIHMNPGLKWSDGQPLTADDVAFTINTFANPDFGAVGFPTTEGISATATDSTTVTVTLTTPDVTLVALLADPVAAPMPKHVFGSMKAADMTKSNENNAPSVSSGPFVVSDRKQGDSITVKKNRNFYMGPDKPYLDGITFKMIGDTTTILTAAQAGQFDAAWFVPINDLDSYKALPEYNTGYDRVGTSYEGAYFNMKSPILQDKLVRQALAQSFDPKEIISTIWKGTATYTCDDNPGNAAHSTDLIGATGCYTVNQEAAGKLLDQAGWTMGSDGYRHKGGKVLELRYSTTAGRKYREDSELIAQAAWKRIGVKIKIVNYPARVLFANDKSGILCSGNYDIAEFARGSTIDPDDHSIWASDQLCPNGGNNSFYKNDTVDQLYKDETSNPDMTKRLQDLKQIQKQLIDDAVVVWLYAFPNIYVSKKTLKGYTPSAFAQDTWNCYDWHK
ncbi:MAG TPA: peptide ABC transporter substrate-binding protein [Ktedonobacterales bacterium]